MSLFDYPRINFEGTLQLSPGTANNDDYAANYILPQSWGAYAGQPLALIDSKTVEARTYGMSDADFIAWAQQVQIFDVVGGKPGETKPAIHHKTEMSSCRRHPPRVNRTERTCIGFVFAWASHVLSVSDGAVESLLEMETG